MPNVLLTLKCGRCGREQPATLSEELLRRLEESGATPEQVAASIQRGLLSGQLVCRGCAATRAN